MVNSFFLEQNLDNQAKENDTGFKNEISQKPFLVKKKKTSKQTWKEIQVSCVFMITTDCNKDIKKK